MSAPTRKIRVLLAAGAVVLGPTILTACAATADDAEPETRAFDLAGAELTIAKDNGATRVEEPTADLTMATTSGALRATGITSGRVEAKSENGSVDLAFAKAPDDITVTTTTGR